MDLFIDFVRLNRQFSFSGSNILQTSPSAMHRLRDSSSSDIQIAAESDLSRERARFSLEASSCSSSSLRALCGPNPAKISLVCVLVISVWLMAVLVMHLDKKLSLTTETLEETREKIQTIQDAVEGDRCGRLFSVCHYFYWMLNLADMGLNNNYTLLSKDCVD